MPNTFFAPAAQAYCRRARQASSSPQPSLAWTTAAASPPPDVSSTPSIQYAGPAEACAPLLVT